MDVICLPVGLGIGGLGKHGSCLFHHYNNAKILISDQVNSSGNFPFRFIQKIGQKLGLLPIKSVYDGYNLSDLFFAHELDKNKIIGDKILCFSGCAIHSFRIARKNRIRELHLESPTAHIRYCWSQFEKALQLHNFEKSWLDRCLVEKMLGEYQEADYIWVNSEYSYKTFIDEGVPPSKLMRRKLQVEDRFKQVKNNQVIKDPKFVFVGSVTVFKGVPLLIEAFHKIFEPSARLVLVGGTSSRGMAKFVKKAILNDPRISICQGDPIPHLMNASSLVHPSWCDGLGLAGLEAIAMGVPVIASADSGMKEYISDGDNGFIVPTGDSVAIYEKLNRFLLTNTNHA